MAADYCMACGACAGAAPAGAVTLEYDPSCGMPRPRVHDVAAAQGLPRAICPGGGYPIIGLSRALFGETPQRTLELGAWRGLWAARSSEAGLCAQASSGGVMTAIAAHLLGQGLVQGVVVTRMAFGPAGPAPHTWIARSVDELLAAQGSKYCPVPALSILPEMARASGPLAFIGTPCQIAAVRLLQQQEAAWRETIRYTIGNFCGGFRDHRETLALIRRAGFDPARVVAFRYRGDGQPGSLYIEDDTGRSVRWAYPGYARKTGFIKHLRCRLCVDATAELADFACGDAWLGRFLDTGLGWSLVLTRSEAAHTVFQAMLAQGQVEVADVSVEEVLASQRQNLGSKKARQQARRLLLRRLGRRCVPAYDGGYTQEAGSLLLEARVHVSHTLMYALERMGLYPAVMRLLRR
jgi:coenzyme F420 hydrogenase subunit beta